MANNYKNGDIVTDTVFRETFTYDHKVDSWLAKNRPNQLRYANDNEKDNLKRRGVKFYYYSTRN